jgi:hypothetical protein
VKGLYKVRGRKAEGTGQSETRIGGKYLGLSRLQRGGWAGSRERRNI